MKKKFWIDIDDTIIKLWEDEIFSVYNARHNKSLKFEDVKSHNFNGDENLRKVFFEYFYKNHSKLKLFDWVREKLGELKEKFDLYLITSRPVSDIELTMKDIHFLFWKKYFKDIIFTCNHSSDKKCELSNKIWFDVVIDDAPHHIENYIKNTKIKKIIIFDQPWNRELKEDNKRVFRVKSWFDVNL